MAAPKLSQKTRENYENCILPFWKNLIDDENGGFYGYVDYDLTVDKKAEKGVILNSRILWFFSNAFLVYADEDALYYAKHAYKFLREHCLDRENGGVFWMLNADGSPKDKIKHTYNQAFAIYALSSYYDATGDHAALETAFEIFQLLEDICTDDIGYLEAFSCDFVPIDNDALSENGLLADRTMNTLLHLLEAYTELYRVSGDEDVESRLRFILNEFKTKLWNKEKKLLEVFFDYNMNSIADMQSFGHDIEGSWLLDRACEVLGDSALFSETRAYTKIIAETVYERAYKNHHLTNERFAETTDPTVVWWVQAEAIVGFLNAYKYTSDEKFLTAAEDIWDYIEKYLVDKRPHSEWFWDLDEDGAPTSKKAIVEPWKCPYHNGRLCFETFKRDF